MTIYLKYFALKILREILNVFNIFPIKKNRIVFYSYNGKQYSCNPKQISEYLNEKYPEQYEIIWAFKDPKKEASKLPTNVKTVKYRSFLYYYYAKTARVIVQNVDAYGELKRRKGQDIIQTWHASNGYKLGRVKRFTVGVQRKLVLLSNKDYTYVMCGCKSMLQRRFSRASGFTGTVIPGTPRMDLLLNNNPVAYEKYKNQVCNFIGINNQKKIALYAPTWRRDRDDNDYGLDYLALRESLRGKFGGDWIIAVRLHPNVYTKPIIKYPFVKDLTSYPDMQELLSIVDCLISDYSSCVWDFSFTYKPCFLFCPDLKQYGKVIDFEIPIRDWHFPIAENMSELCNEIAMYDENIAKNNINLHHKEMGNLEDGKATERACFLIEELCASNSNKERKAEHEEI